MNTVDIRALTKQYDGAAAVDALNLTVGDGEFLTLLGPSGCGKTTTLRCIAGLEQPSAGQILYGDDVIVDCDRRINIPVHKRDIGMVFQSYALWPHMSVLGNVAYPLRVEKISRAEAHRRAEEALELVGLGGYGSRGASALSGGQQQRVALARALVRRPRVLLLDEPLSNLDATLRTQMRTELRRIHRETGTTTIYVTHDQLEAATLSGRVVVMNGGHAIQAGTPHEIFRRPQTAWVANFVGFENVVHGAVERVEADEVVVRPDGWATALVCHHDQGLSVGQRVGLAIRSTALGLGADGDEPNTFLAALVDSAYLGNLTEYTLDVNGTRLTASASRAALNGAVTGEHDLAVHVDPEAIAVVAEDQ